LGFDEKLFLEISQRWEKRKKRFWRFPNVGKREKTVFGEIPTFRRAGNYFFVNHTNHSNHIEITIDGIGSPPMPST
jgi:hypothetical protein